MDEIQYGLRTQEIQKTMKWRKKSKTKAGWLAVGEQGSQLYKSSLENGYKLPENYSGYSFHSYDTQPLPTEYLTPAEVLSYRDECFTRYHTYKPFLERIENKFGTRAKENIMKMASLRLKRKILGD